MSFIYDILLYMYLVAYLLDWLKCKAHLQFITSYKTFHVIAYYKH